MLSEPTPSSILVLSYLFLNIFMHMYVSLTKPHWLSFEQRDDEYFLCVH